MADSSSFDRVKKNPPKVPFKSSNSVPNTANDQTTPQKENGTTPVDSDVRPIAKPRGATLQRAPKGSNEQKLGILLPCFGEYKAQNAGNRRLIHQEESQTDNGVAVKVASDAQSPKTPNSEHGNKLSPISPSSRADKPKLLVTRGTPGTYRKLPPPPVIGSAPRKPAMPPGVNLSRFNVVLELENFEENLSVSRMEDRRNMQYDEAIYEA